VPGIGIRNADVKRLMKECSDTLNLDVQELLTARAIGGDYEVEFQGRSVRAYNDGDVATFAFSCGGTGYGDVLDRDPKAVEIDLVKGVLSEQAALSVYKVVWDGAARRVDLDATAKLRAEELAARKKRGRKYDEFEAEWLKQKPRDEILTYYGSWPDAKVVTPLMRA
jgi:acetophenone carboxylase